MIFAGVYGAGENLLASAKIPQAVVEWSNGFPSREHWTVNIHGKKLDPPFNCDNSVIGGFQWYYLVLKVTLVFILLS